MRYVLSINALSLYVSIGVLDIEHEAEQEVLLDIDLIYNSRPACCDTDSITDTDCYQTIIEHLILHTKTKHFSLIEHFASFVMHQVQSVSHTSSVRVKVKKFPIINGLQRTVSFEINSY